MQTICVGCSKTFSTSDKRQIYCSKKCRSRDYYIIKVTREGKDYHKRSPKTMMCWKCCINMVKISPTEYICNNCGSKYIWENDRIKEKI